MLSSNDVPGNKNATKLYLEQHGETTESSADEQTKAPRTSRIRSSAATPPQ